MLSTATAMNRPSGDHFGGDQVDTQHGNSCIAASWLPSGSTIRTCAVNPPVTFGVVK